MEQNSCQNAEINKKWSYFPTFSPLKHYYVRNTASNSIRLTFFNPLACSIFRYFALINALSTTHELRQEETIQRIQHFTTQLRTTMQIGKYNRLLINRFVDFGAYLIDDEDNEVLLPKRYLTGDEELDDEIEVFVYNDSENRPVATTEQPFATVGQFCLLRVKAVNAIGAFLDWGLAAKDLLVPFREQRVRMQAGRSYIVFVYLDPSSQRIVASAKLDKFLSNSIPDYYHRQKVDALIVQQQEIGYRVIIDGKFWGMIYNNEIYQPVNIGEHHMAFVKQVREDGKIDITLAKIEKMRIDDVAELIIKHLNAHNGEMALNDKSSPDDILRTFNCSKKDFKKALGLLYKQHKITLGNVVKRSW